MDSAEEEITRIAHDLISDVESVFIDKEQYLGHPSLAVPEALNVIVRCKDDRRLMRRALRRWDPDRGFHSVLEPVDFVTNDVNHIIWDPERKKMENEVITVGERGASNIVLELRSNVKDELQPTNYASPLSIQPLKTVEIQLGSKASNKLSFFVDSGSNDFWVQSKSKRNERVPEGLSFFDLTVEEELFTPVPKAGSHKIQYGPAKTDVFVTLFNGEITIGNLRMTQVIGIARVALPPSTLPVGILGLGFTRQGSPAPFHRNLVVQMRQSGLIKRASFALVGPRAGTPESAIPRSGQERNRGWLILGEIDEKYHTGITWCPVLLQKYHKWVVRLRKVTVNGEVVCENQDALIDTGCSYLVASQVHAQCIADKLGGSLNNGRVASPVGALRKFGFTFGESGATAEFFLNDEDLSLGPIAGSTSEQVWLPLTYLEQVDETQNDYWVLGGIFIDNMITIFDYTGEKRLGFASQSDIDPPLTPSATV